MRVFEGRTGWTLLFALGVIFPFAASNDYMLTVMSTAYIFALATVGLNLITGYTGQFNLAHGSFMALGAYTVGIRFRSGSRSSRPVSSLQSSARWSASYRCVCAAITFRFSRCASATSCFS